MKVVTLFFPTPNQDKMKSIAEACLRLTPQVALTGEAIFLEVSRCARLYSQDSLKARLQRLSQKFQVSPRIVFADDVPTALALARYQKSSKIELPVLALRDFINPWGMDDSVDRVIDTLHDLGIKTIGGFLYLPRHVWSFRFGAFGVHIEKRVRDASDIPWPQFQLPEKILETVEFDENQATGNLETVLFYIKTIIDRVMLRLRGKGEVPSKLKLSLVQEKFSHVKYPLILLPFDFPLPQSSIMNMVTIFRERLQSEFSRAPLQSELISISLEVLESVPKPQAQTNFFHKHEQKQEEWRSLLARLTNKLGPQSVFTAIPNERYLPEKSWQKKFSPDFKEQGGSNVRDHSSPNLSIPHPDDDNVVPLVRLKEKFPERPLRLLKSPQKVDLRRWRLIDFDGPEKLSGEWWSQPYNREYYRVTADNGEQLWIYKEVRTQDYYLHGVFD